MLCLSSCPSLLAPQWSICPTFIHPTIKPRAGLYCFRSSVPHQANADTKKPLLLPLQVTCVQRSHENLVLILIPLNPRLHARDSNVISPPSHSLRKAPWSIPLPPQPAAPEPQDAPPCLHTQPWQQGHSCPPKFLAEGAAALP